MGKLGEELNHEGRLPSNRFRVDEILKEMSEEDRVDLLAALANENITLAAIVRVLKRRGHKVSENAIRNYRTRL